MTQFSSIAKRLNRLSLSQPEHSADLLRRAVRAGVEALESRTFLSTTSLLPTADSYVRNHAFRSTNYGDSPVLGVKTAGSGDSRTSFLKFDISNIGVGIASAKLQLTAGLQNGSNAASITGVFPVQDTSWVEGDGQIAFRNRTDSTLDLTHRITGHGDGYDRDNNPDGELTWNNQPAADLLPVDVVTVDSELLRTYSIDLTTYILAARALGRDTITLALKNPAATDSFTRVLSREFSGAEPRLLITSIGETAAPTAQIAAPDVTASGGAANTITVTYTGDGIDPNSLGADDLSVLDPNGNSINVSAPTLEVRDGSIVATYDLAAPGGSWDSADNGIYRVQVNAGAVSGAGGDSSPALAEFRAKVDDAAAPSVVITPTAPTLGSTTYTFTAVFSDNVAIDASTINLNNFQIDAPDGSGLGFTKVELSSDENTGAITATYTTEAPGGPDHIGWTPAFDGQWTITLRDNQVFDTAGNAIVAASQVFQVNLAPADTSGPDASINVDNISAPGGTVHTVRVDYDDDAGIDVNSLGTSDITVKDSSGNALNVTGFTINSEADDDHKRVTYTFSAPGGSWDAADNGTYTVTLNNGEVKDANGNAAPSTSKTFTVNATGSDTTGPTATFSISDLLTAGASPQVVTVTYNDNVAVDVASLGLDDITVTGPSGAVAVTDINITAGSSGSPVTVAYKIAPPSGFWTSADNGTYTVTLNTSSVRDTSNNAASAASGSFAVNIAGGSPADPSFNADAPRFTVQGVVTQSDGKLLLAGYIGSPTNGSSRAVLERRNANGSIDTTFGTNGQILSPSGANDANYALILQGDKVITAGTGGGNFVLTRYDLAGKIDSTFGVSGHASADFGAADAAFALTAAPNGALVAVGTSGGNFAIARFADNGATDLSFGERGLVLYSAGQVSDGLGAVVVQSDGKIVAAGARGTAVAVLRLRADGTADSSFSGDGLLLVGGLTVSASSGTIPDHSQAIALQSDGRVVISNRTPDGNFGLARITTGGNIDSSFGDDGLATATFEGDADVDALIVQSTGQILAVGTVQSGGLVKTGVAAFDGNGHLISSFGEGGTTTVDANILPSGRELHIGDLVVRAFGTRQADGRIIVGSSNQNASVGTGSSLNRLIVPGSSTSAASPQESVIGSFGIVNGKKQKLTFPAPAGGATITLTLAGGTGTVFSESGVLRISMSDLGPGAKLTVKAKGGNGRAAIGDVSVTGVLKGFTGKMVDLSGNLFVTGAIGKVAIGNLTGTIASASGFIGNVSAVNLNGAAILSGANLGSDAKRGGSTTAADSFVAGTIGSVKVTGTITSSVIGAGADPNGDDNFLDDDNHVLGGAASSIKSISSKGATDASSRFYAGVFGTAKIPSKIDPAGDPHFKTA